MPSTLALSSEAHLASTADPILLSEIRAARREAIAVMRSVVATLAPGRDRPSAAPDNLAALREARLAAAQVLAIPLSAAAFPAAPAECSLTCAASESPPNPVPVLATLPVPANDAALIAQAEETVLALLDKYPNTFAARRSASGSKNHPQPAAPLTQPARWPASPHARSAQALRGRAGAPPCPPAPS